jgi:hypothetical protein
MWTDLAAFYGLFWHRAEIYPHFTNKRTDRSKTLAAR